MKKIAKVRDSAAAGVRKGGAAGGGVAVVGEWEFVCRDKNGREKWRERTRNLVVDEGLNYLLDAGLSGGTPVTNWYLGLVGSTPSPAAGDTMSSHDGWTEVEDYDEANRPAWTDGGVSNKSVSNAGTKAEFTISDTVTVGGAFLTSDNTKGGTSGKLYAVTAFSGGDRELQDDDVLSVTATYTIAAAS